MKLTDKDLLADAVQGAINIMEANGINMISASVPLAIIKGAPTVEAIPVEWIKSRWGKNILSFSDRQWCEQWLIDDWQKEQEASE